MLEGIKFSFFWHEPQRYCLDVGNTQAFITEMLHDVAVVGRPVRMLHEYRNTTAIGYLQAGATRVLSVTAMLQYIEYSFSDRAIRGACAAHAFMAWMYATPRPPVQ